MNAAGGPGEPGEPAHAALASTGPVHSGPVHSGPVDTGPGNPYEPPSVTYLGTLRELTLGGVSGPDDGVGGAGGIGSL